MIDQASYVLENAEVAKFINHDVNRGNHYLILGRSLPIYMDARYMTKIKANDNHIGIRYLFER